MSVWLNLVFKIKHTLIVLEKLMAAGSLILLLSLSMFQLLARNFFDTGFTHMDTVTRHLILFIIFMGAALVSEQNRHIKIDVLTPFLTFEQQQKLLRPLLFLSAIISTVFAWYSLMFWLDEWHYAPANERWSVYLALILPLGFSVLSLHLFLLTITGLEPDKVRKNPLPPCSCSDFK